MTMPERGEAVRKVQAALIDLGYPMPASTRTDGTLDGIFGSETTRTVATFKSNHQPAIHPSDGVVGRQTMAALDALFTRPGKPSPTPVPPPVPPLPHPPPVPPLPIPHKNPILHRNYKFFLREATRMLRDSYFGQPLSPDFDDHFDKEFWDWDGDPKYTRVLTLRPGKRPADAIDALFHRLSDWRIDCDYTVQIANLYAARKTFGAAGFNQQEGLRMRLKSRESTGVVTQAHFGRLGPTDAWKAVLEFRPPNIFRFADAPITKTTEQLVNNAPVGSRVRWTNLQPDPSDAFRHENAVKLDTDLYAAAGIDPPLTGNEFTRDRLEIEMALMSFKKPTRQDIRRNIFIDEVEAFDTP